MPPIVSELDFWLAIGTILLQIGILKMFLVLGFWPNSTSAKLIRRFALPLGFFLACFATALSLVYSEVFGFVPCGLCWLQRLCLYPQIALFGIAWWKTDKNVWRYIVTLSLTGVVIGLYQHYLQIGGTPLGACPVSGGDCTQRILFEFGYITFPLISASLLAFLGLLGYSLRHKDK